MEKMKHLSALLLFLLLSLMALLNKGCNFDDCTAMITYTEYDPVYMTRAELNESVTTLPARALERPHKIYSYGNYLLIGEKNLGIHVFDNSNPMNPIALAFINIPGNNDMVVMNGFLYADQAADLIVLTIDDPANATLIARQEEFFNRWCHGCTFSEELGYLAYYAERIVTEATNCNQRGGGWRGGFDDAVTFNAGFASSNQGGSNVNSQSGQGGSMARFTLLNGHLYAVDHTKLYTISINNPYEPAMLSETNIGWGIETIYPYTDKLFIGSNIGMYIYDVSTPSSPVYVSEFNHAMACDPVVVEGNRAYVTLRSGNACVNASNQLDVLDISDIYNPSLIKTYPMQNPHGLAIRDKTLYICEGSYGLKVFDASDDQKIDKNRLAWLKKQHAFDVISLSSDHLLLVGDDGLYQYEVSNPSKPITLSHIPIQRP